MSHIHLVKKDNIGIIQMDRDKANPMNHEFVAALRIAFKNLLEDDRIEGVILNGKENFFSAGLDLPELYNYDEQQFDNFWRNFMELIYDMIAFDKPLVASITGHSPAGGCVLAICCDYRVMAEGKYVIGLNEIPVGLVLPRALFEIYSFWLGTRTAYQYGLEGKLVSPAQAKEIGLVDEVVVPTAVLEAAETQLKRYLQFDKKSWRITKKQMKQNLLKSITNASDFEMNAFVQQWWSEPVRTGIKHFVDKLKK